MLQYKGIKIFVHEKTGDFMSLHEQISFKTP
jgi:hypothetical protein